MSDTSYLQKRKILDLNIFFNFGIPSKSLHKGLEHQGTSLVLLCVVLHPQLHQQIIRWWMRPGGLLNQIFPRKKSTATMVSGNMWVPHLQSPANLESCFPILGFSSNIQLIHMEHDSEYISLLYMYISGQTMPTVLLAFFHHSGNCSSQKMFLVIWYLFSLIFHHLSNRWDKHP